MDLKSFPHQDGFCQWYSIRWKSVSRHPEFQSQPIIWPLLVLRLVIQPFCASVSLCVSNGFVTLFLRWSKLVHGKCPAPNSAWHNLQFQWELHLSYNKYREIIFILLTHFIHVTVNHTREGLQLCHQLWAPHCHWVFEPHHYPCIASQDLFLTLSGCSCLNDFDDGNKPKPFWSFPIGASQEAGSEKPQPRKTNNQSATRGTGMSFCKTQLGQKQSIGEF